MRIGDRRKFLNRERAAALHPLRWGQIGVILVAAAVTCSAPADKTSAERAVEHFHDLYNASQFGEMYQLTSPEFQRTNSEPEWTRFMEAVRRKAGRYESATQRQWTVAATTAGTTVSLAYATTFSSVAATEQFTWKITGGQTRLMAYKLDSPALIMN